MRSAAQLGSEVNFKRGRTSRSRISNQESASLDRPSATTRPDAYNSA